MPGKAHKPDKQSRELVSALALNGVAQDRIAMHVGIHDKFIVVDFNGDNPAVFTGSSNLAEGGEQANGDSLIMVSRQGGGTAAMVDARLRSKEYQVS